MAGAEELSLPRLWDSCHLWYALKSISKAEIAVPKFKRTDAYLDSVWLRGGGMALSRRFILVLVVLLAAVVGCYSSNSDSGSRSASNEKLGEEVEKAKYKAGETKESWTEWAKEKMGLKEDEGGAERTTKDMAAEKAKDFKDAAAEKASEMASAAKGKISETLHAVKEELGAATEAEEKASLKAEKAKENAKETAQEAAKQAEMAKEKGSKKAEEAQEEAKKQQERVEENLKWAKEKAKEGYETAKNKSGETIESAKLKSHQIEDEIATTPGATPTDDEEL